MASELVEEWNTLPEELKPLFIEIRHIEYFTYTSIDIHHEKNEGRNLYAIAWQNVFGGPLPKGEGKNALIRSILRSIQSLDKPEDHIVNGIYRLSYETKVIKEVEEDEKKKVLLETEKNFLLRQLQFLYDPAVTFKSRKWPRTFGRKPSDFSNIIKMELIENSLLDQLSKWHKGDPKTSQKNLESTSTSNSMTSKPISRTRANPRPSTTIQTSQKKTASKVISTRSKKSTISSKTSSINSSNKDINEITGLSREEEKTREQRRLKRFKTLPGAQGETVITDMEDKGYLNWNITDFQSMLREDSHWNNPTIYTFVNIVKHHYSSSIYYTADKYECSNMKEWKKLETDEIFVKERKQEFEKVENICRLMITGTEKYPHYQVVVFIRKKSEITIIDCSSNDDLDKKQVSFIDHTLKHMGWIIPGDTLKLERSHKGGQNDISNPTSWYYNYHTYNPLSQEDLSQAVKEKKLSELSGPFSCLVYFHIMTCSDRKFQPALMDFNDRIATTNIRLNIDSMRWDVIRIMKQLLPQYIHATFKSVQLEIQRFEGSSGPEQARIFYTKRLLGLNDKMFQASIRPSEDQTCICHDSEHKTKFHFYPSCCFRAYHADCYLEYLYDQIGKKKKNHYCKHCRDTDEVILGVIDYDAMTVVDILPQSSNAIHAYVQFTHLSSKFDNKHR